MCESELHAFYCDRVPSASNPADPICKRLGSSSMLSGSDSRGRAQPWQKSPEPLALTSTREKCYGRLKTVKSKNGKKQGAAKPALSRKVQDFEGCLSPCRTMTWSKEDWRFSIQNSPSARFAIWSANTSRDGSFWQVYGLCTLALLVSTWVLSSAPHAFQSWEKASLVSGTSIWDEPNNHELIGRGPTADAESERACKRVGEDVGRRDMTRFCVAVQVGWNTFLDNCHHCNVCSRCLLAPCLCSQRTWPARIPLLAVREKTRHRHRMAPQRMPLRMFFSSRTVASSCFRRQPCGSLRRCSNSSQRSKLHTSPKQISTWKSLSKTIRYNETPCKGSPKFGSHPLRDADVEGGRTDRKLRAWCKRKRPPRECMTDSCLKRLRQRTLWAMRQGLTWHRWTRNCSWVPCLAPLRSQEVCHIGPHQESRKTPCRSCPPNRTCRSRQSAHPYSSVGFASKCMRSTHRDLGRPPTKDRSACKGLRCNCQSSRALPSARDCNHHQSCDPQRAMLSAEAGQAMSKEIQLSLRPDAGPNDDSTQVGEAARAREPRSRYRPAGSRRRTEGELQRRKAKQGTGFWATPQGRRLTALREGEPVQNRGVWRNWRTSETASESASTRTRNAQQTWNQTGQDWQRDRPSSSQDWRHDWQWEGDRDRTPKTSSASNTARGSRRAQTMSRGARDVAPRGCRPSGCPEWHKPSGAELWQLDAELLLLGLSFDGANGELNVLGEDL